MWHFERTWQANPLNEEARACGLAFRLLLRTFVKVKDLSEASDAMQLDASYIWSPFETESFLVTYNREIERISEVILVVSGAMHHPSKPLLSPAYEELRSWEYEHVRLITDSKDDFSRGRYDGMRSVYYNNFDRASLGLNEQYRFGYNATIEEYKTYAQICYHNH